MKLNENNFLSFFLMTLVLVNFSHKLSKNSNGLNEEKQIMSLTCYQIEKNDSKERNSGKTADIVQYQDWPQRTFLLFAPINLFLLDLISSNIPGLLNVSRVYL